jgi:tRNA-binding EMAP/Myf-like protein
MRKLASIQKILKLEPIEGADKIVKATVLGWEVVVGKNDFKVDDLVVYCEVDSVLPDRPEFEFMRTRKFRVKTIKLRGQISQGIVFPLSILPKGTKVKEDKEVTEDLNIIKYEPPTEKVKIESIYPKWMPTWMKNFIKKIRKILHLQYREMPKLEFPSDIPKTDETRVQVLQGLLNVYKGHKAYATEKADGSSITIRYKKGKVIVASRNRTLRKKTGKYWEAVLALDLENRLKKYFHSSATFALQGELIGPGIQGNKYKLEKHEIRFFDTYYPDDKLYGSLIDLTLICKDLGLRMATVVIPEFELPTSIPEIVEMSKGKSIYGGEGPREGIVIRLHENLVDTNTRMVRNSRVSLKAINPKFLLKYNL